MLGDSTLTTHLLFSAVNSGCSKRREFSQNWLEHSSAGAQPNDVRYVWAHCKLRIQRRFDKPHYPPKQIFVSDKMAEQPELISDNLLKKACLAECGSVERRLNFVLARVATSSCVVQLLQHPRCRKHSRQRWCNAVAKACNPQSLFVAQKVTISFQYVFEAS